VAAIALEGLWKRYPRGAAAVRGVDLAVPDGAFMALVGPSGSGKSTTLHLIAGLDEPSEGTIRFDGEVVNARAPRERDVAVVFQSYALYPHKTVFENLAFPLRIAREARAEIERRVRAAAARLGLERLLERRPRELSGGQRQRVALGRALVRRPRAFLLDEPLSNLDPALRAEMRAEIKRLHGELGTTFVYVTHDQAEAMTLADRIAVFADGRVVEVAAPRDLYERPETVFVARFFGSPAVSLLRARGEGRALALAAGRVELAREAPAGALLLGVRPEDARVVAPGEGLRGRIYVVEPLGAETFVTVELEGGDRVACREEPGFAGRAGEAAGVRVHPQRLHLFDPASGRRISSD
jgi:multiple sugar transport system ATP-binding protein